MEGRRRQAAKAVRVKRFTPSGYQRRAALYKAVEPTL
jgi:hypothetical protein